MRAFPQYPKTEMADVGASALMPTSWLITSTDNGCRFRGRLDDCWIVLPQPFARSGLAGSCAAAGRRLAGDRGLVESGSVETKAEVGAPTTAAQAT